MSLYVLAAFAAASVASSPCHVERFVGAPDGLVLGLPVEHSQDDGTVQGGIKLAESKRIKTASGRDDVRVERSEAPATAPASRIKIERSTRDNARGAKMSAQDNATAGSATGSDVPVFRSEQSADQATSC